MYRLIRCACDCRPCCVRHAGPVNRITSSNRVRIPKESSNAFDSAAVRVTQQLFQRNGCLNLAIYCQVHDALQEQVEVFVKKQADAATAAASTKHAPSNKRSGEKAATATAAKAPKLEAASAPASASAVKGEGIALTTDGMSRCTVTEFKGKTYVNLRVYYTVRPPLPILLPRFATCIMHRVACVQPGRACCVAVDP